MNHRIAIIFATDSPPSGHGHEYVWAGDSGGGVYIRVVTAVMPHERLERDPNQGEDEGNALEAAMDLAPELGRDGETFCNTVKAVGIQGDA